MSSKLVKKQLGAVLAGAVEKSQASQSLAPNTKASKRKQDKKKKDRKTHKNNKQAPNPDRILESNLKYLRGTLAPSAATQDLLSQVIK